MQLRGSCLGAAVLILPYEYTQFAASKCIEFFNNSNYTRLCMELFYIKNCFIQIFKSNYLILLLQYFNIVWLPS